MLKILGTGARALTWIARCDRCGGKSPEQVARRLDPAALPAGWTRYGEAEQGHRCPACTRAACEAGWLPREQRRV